ncbi:MAG: hypothetical protein HDQ99_02860 [Lachnospiraceae bacterium]|nr:hypothetical protein [Lachnospiraceae bacterium]
MRLIDADNLIYNDVECTDGNTYMVVHAPRIDNADVYNFESVVDKIQQKALEHSINGNQYTEDGYDNHAKIERAIQKGIEIALEIVNSGWD